MPDDPHEQPGPTHPWRIFVDTGGTFTDCLALAPDGAVRRAKVLSSGSLRAAVAAVDSPTAVVLTAPWLERPGFAVGATLACRGARARVAAVEPIDHQTARATLDAPIPAMAPGDTAELSTGEEAPILAARMVTGAPAGEPLPPTHLRLATTRGTNALLERARPHGVLRHRGVRRPAPHRRPDPPGPLHAPRPPPPPAPRPGGRGARAAGPLGRGPHGAGPRRPAFAGAGGAGRRRPHRGGRPDALVARARPRAGGARHAAGARL